MESRQGHQGPWLYLPGQSFALVSVVDKPNKSHESFLTYAMHLHSERTKSIYMLWWNKEKNLNLQTVRAKTVESITNGIVASIIYDKRDYLNFIVNFSFLARDVLHSPS